MLGIKKMKKTIIIIIQTIIILCLVSLYIIEKRVAHKPYPTLSNIVISKNKAHYLALMSDSYTVFDSRNNSRSYPSNTVLEYGQFSDTLPHALVAIASITEDELQKTSDNQIWFSSLYSIDNDGVAIIKVGELKPKDRITSIAEYTWRKWDVVKNKNLGILQVCNDPFEDYKNKTKTNPNEITPLDQISAPRKSGK
jgi:hypothetical protein